MNNQAKNIFPVKEGFLTKEGRQFKTLRLRWFVLYDDRLEYYETENKSKLKGQITISENSFVSDIRHLNLKIHAITLHSSKRILHLFGSLENIEDWKCTLDSRIYYLKFSRNVSDTISTVFKGQNEIHYVTALINMGILYNCDQQTLTNLFSLIGYKDDKSIIKKDNLERIIILFQPLLNEDEVIFNHRTGFKISEIVFYLSQPWFSGFESYLNIEKRFKGSSPGTYCISFSSTYLHVYTLSVQLNNEKCDHWRIILTSRGFELEDYVSFKTLYDLVHWYSTHQLPNTNVYLLYPSGKPEFISQFPSKLIDDNFYIYRINVDQVLNPLPLEKPIKNQSIASNDISIQNQRINFKKTVLKEKLGKGKNGINFYRCNIDGLTCVVRIIDVKKFTNDEVKHFIEDIEILNSLTECNYIVKYLYHTFTDDRIQLFLEYLPSSLYSIIRFRELLRKPLSPLVICRIALDIIRGIHELENRYPPLTHRNIHSENIFMTLSSSEMPSDLKLGYIKNHLTLDDKRILAPEVIMALKKKEPFTYKTSADIFNFGIVLYELITLKQPYQKEKNLHDIILKGNMPSYPPLPKKYDPLIALHKKCMSFEPNKRPSTKEIISVLSRMVDATLK